MEHESLTQPESTPDQQFEKHGEIGWPLFEELRKELVETQALRTRVIGLKVAFVSATAALVAGLDRVDPMLLVVPAFAAIFFDVLINSYSFSVKRIGAYTRDYLEPQIRKERAVPKEMLLWEEFMLSERSRQYMATVGNLGLTLLACASAEVALYPFRLPIPFALGVALLAFFIYDAWSSWFVKRHRFQEPQDVTESSSRVPRDRTPSVRPPRFLLFPWKGAKLPETVNTADRPEEH
jgi:hypothetical protein